MAVAPRLIIFGTDIKPLVGPIPIPDIEIPDLTGCDAHEFNHSVWSYTKDDQISFGEILIRVHEPMRIVKQIDCYSVLLYKFLTLGTYLPKAEIRWYQYDEEKHKQTEYLRMTLEHLRIKSIRTILPNVKDTSNVQFNHLEELQLVYQRITWLHPKGYLYHMDEWNNGFFSEGNENDFSGKKNDEFDDEETAIIVETLKVVFNKGTFIEPQGGFDFDNKIVVRFNANVNRKFNSKEGKVFAKLYAKYNDKTEDLRQINEGTLRENGSWQTEFTLQKPASYEKDTNKKPDAIVEYYAEIESKYASAPFKSESIKVPSLIIPQLDIEHLYHDNEPVQEADFEIELENGTTQQGKLDKVGKAVVKDLERKPVRVRFGPDTRDYSRVDSRKNEYFIENFTQQDATNVVDNGIAHEERPPEQKSIITDSISFVWGALQGSFNQKQSVSQIIVDAVIGVIPVVGDVTAARDLIAIIIRLSLQPEKRKEILEWAGLVLMLFALIPVAGGVIKGVGRLLLKSGKEASKIGDLIAVLNRIGIGNAEKFIKELNLTSVCPKSSFSQ
jgi:type VI secretion system Hcp family effector